MYAKAFDVALSPNSIIILTRGECERKDACLCAHRHPAGGQMPSLDER